jgi:hypothetical protein
MRTLDTGYGKLGYVDRGRDVLGADIALGKFLFTHGVTMLSGPARLFNVGSVDLRSGWGIAAQSQKRRENMAISPAVLGPQPDLCNTPRAIVVPQ